MTHHAATTGTANQLTSSNPQLVRFVSFAVLAVLVEVEGAVTGERRLLTEIDDATGPAVDDAMRSLGRVTDTPWLLAATAVFAVVLARRSEWRSVARLLLIVLVAWIVNWLFKQLFARPRPIGAGTEAVSPYGFPSGHSANSLSLLGGVVVVVGARRTRRIVLGFGLPLVLLIGLSRLAIAVHYPSDVVAAWLWVSGWLVLVWPSRGER